MTQAATDQEVLGQDAAGVYLGGVPARTLRNWRHLNKGPAYVKYGRHVGYLKADLDAYIAAQRKVPSGA